jgi:hypothetical protein
MSKVAGTDAQHLFGSGWISNHPRYPTRLWPVHHAIPSHDLIEG